MFILEHVWAPQVGLSKWFQKLLLLYTEIMKYKTHKMTSVSQNVLTNFSQKKNQLVCGFTSLCPFKFSSDPITEVSLHQSSWLYCHITRITQIHFNIFQTEGEVQCGSGEVGEVKEYVREFTRDFSLLMLIRFSYTQAHYGLDHIGYADNVKNETSRGEPEEKSEIKERMKVWQISPPYVCQ